MIILMEDCRIIPNPFALGGLCDQMHAREMREHLKREKLIQRCKRQRRRIRELEAALAAKP